MIRLLVIRKEKKLYPEGFYFKAGGASVHHLAAPGDGTFARLTRLKGRYRMHVLQGAFVHFADDVNESLMRQSDITGRTLSHASMRHMESFSDAMARITFMLFLVITSKSYA